MDESSEIFAQIVTYDVLSIETRETRKQMTSSVSRTTRFIIRNADHASPRQIFGYQHGSIMYRGMKQQLSFNSDWHEEYEVDTCCFIYSNF